MMRMKEDYNRIWNDNSAWKRLLILLWTGLPWSEFTQVGTGPLMKVTV